MNTNIFSPSHTYNANLASTQPLQLARTPVESRVAHSEVVQTTVRGPSRTQQRSASRATDLLPPPPQDGIGQSDPTPSRQTPAVQPLPSNSRAPSRSDIPTSNVSSHPRIFQSQTTGKRLSVGYAVAEAIRKLEAETKLQALPSDASPRPKPTVASSSHGRAVQAAITTDNQDCDAEPLDRGEAEHTLATLQLAFSAKYMELADKCKAWERYAAKLAAQNEALQLEKRLLKDLSAKQAERINSLESDNLELKELVAQREDKARDVEIRLTLLESRIGSHAKASPPTSAPRLPQDAIVGSVAAAKAQLRAALEAAYAVPSPPDLSTSHDDAEHSVGHQQMLAFHSSNIVYPDETQRGTARDLPPTPLANHVLPRPNLMPLAATVDLDRPHSRAVSRQTLRRDSIVDEDPCHREMGALYGEGRASRLGNRSFEHANVDDSTAALNAVPLAAHHPRSVQGQQSLGIGKAPTAPRPRPSHAPPTGDLPMASINPLAGSKRMAPEGSVPSHAMAARLNAQKLRVSSPAETGLNNAAMAQVTFQRERLSQAPVPISEAQHRRSVSQQQFQSLQSQTFVVDGHVRSASAMPGPLMGNRSISIVSSTDGSDGPASTRSRFRRSGSFGLHGSIPAIKDDIFSDGSSSLSQPSLKGPTVRANSTGPAIGSGVLPQKSTQPFGSVNVNTLHSRQQQQKKPAATISSADATLVRSDEVAVPPGAMTNNDKTPSAGPSRTTDIDDTSLESCLSPSSLDRGTAHRRLYLALRCELSADQLSKFERYVHRYDALEIPIDGPRGLINRVKKLLLLSDEGLKERPEQWRKRKELAREFEGIVRGDL